MLLRRPITSLLTRCTKRHTRGHHIPKIVYHDIHSRPQSTITPPPPLSISIPHEPLPRSIPHRHALLLLHIPVPPTLWPPKLESRFPLLSTLSLHLAPKNIAVNAVWDGTSHSTQFHSGGYEASLHFPDRQEVRFGDLCEGDVGEGGGLEEGLRWRVDALRARTPGWDEEGGAITGKEKEKMEILVCTHGSRDCRCSERGGGLVTALREEIDRRGVGDNVKVREVAHVGGHKYAANAILLPSLDMISNLLPNHAPSLLSHILNGRPPTSGIWQHWRGRYGLTESQQGDIWASVDIPSRHVGVESGGLEKEVEKVERVDLRFKTYGGEVKDVRGGMGENLLSVGKRYELEGMEGVCGGNLECATCHIYLPPSFPVPQPSGDEEDMLGYAIGHRANSSRLGCQIKITPEIRDWAKAGGIIDLPRF